MQIYVHKNNQQLGPFSEAEIKAQLSAGTLTLADPVWWEGQASWVPLGQSLFAASLTPGVPPPVPPPRPGISPVMPPAGDRTSGMAIASLVCGIASILCGIFTAIPAIILGHMSLAQIKREPYLKGKGMALAGLILGYVLIVLGVIGILVLESLGNQVKANFKTIEAQLNSAQHDSDSSTNSDNGTNSTNGTNSDNKP